MYFKITASKPCDRSSIAILLLAEVIDSFPDVLTKGLAMGTCQAA